VGLLQSRGAMAGGEVQGVGTATLEVPAEKLQLRGLTEAIVAQLRQGG
jgi:hypothetical protein